MLPRYGEIFRDLKKGLLHNSQQALLIAEMECRGQKPGPYERGGSWNVEGGSVPLPYSLGYSRFRIFSLGM